MEPFKLTLANGATLSGRHNLPPHSTRSPKHRPLLIALHGGSYDSTYFDPIETHSARPHSDAFSVPFIAIDRPCYGESTSFLPIPVNSTFQEELGQWLHSHILPALWAQFGPSQHCNSIVLLAHSVGSPGAIIAAGLHAADASPSYPLSGIIFSGYGTQPREDRSRPPTQDPAPEFMMLPREVKDAFMFGPGTAPDAVVALTDALNRPTPTQELADAWGAVPRLRGEWGPKVRVPVMVGLAEREWMWKGTREHLGDIVEAFTESGRVDGSLVVGAPHGMELSWWATGWYGRCFGFALECAATFGVGGAS